MSRIDPSRLLPADLLRVGSLGIATRRMRAALSGLGIAIGIAAMVAVLGISSSSKADLLAQLDRLGTNLLKVSPGQTLGGSDAKLPQDSAAMIRRISGVTDVTGTGKLEATVRRTDHIPKAETRGIEVYAAEPGLLSSLSGTMASGAFLNDANSNYPAVVLGAVAAERLGISKVYPGLKVWLGDRWFDVVGILNPLPLAPEVDRSVLVGYGVAKQYLGFDGSPSTVYVRSNPENVTAVRSLLAQTANPSHPEEVTVSRPSDALAARAATDTAFTALLLGLGSVALLVGGVGIANVMVIAVLERRSEIGLRRALGATRRHIAWQFIAEALLLSLLGGVAGALLGSAATAGYAASRGWAVVVPAIGFVGGVAAAMLTGVVAGSYPAMRAARLAPTEALRSV